MAEKTTLTAVPADCLPYARHQVEEADIAAVADVLRSDRLTQGPRIEAFEETLARRVGARFGVAFSSGTAALHGAVAAAGVGPGDEGITSPMTFCATANCLIYQGARPVFADVNEDTLTLNPDQFEARLTSKTKVVLPVDYAGHPADMERILAIAEKKGITVIEDACHALGARWQGRSIGSISHMTVFSFHPVKHITTGEGGMVVTNNPGFAQRLRAFRTHGIVRDPEKIKEEPWHYAMVSLGWNYRISDIACALGSAQLQRLDANLAHRRELAAAYSAQLADAAEVRLPAVSKDAEPAWHLYPIRLQGQKPQERRAGLFKALVAGGIVPQVHYIPVHYHPYYRERFGLSPGMFPVAEAAYNGLLSLPLFHAMPSGEVSRVVEAVQTFLRRC